MARLLYIESSPRKARSKSINVANAFLAAYKSANPNDEVVTIDLWEKQLPEFDGFTIDAKYQVLHGDSFDDDQAKAWQGVVEVCDEFKSADKYLFSVPMWNFGVPYKLKHYIDVIAQPGQTFSFDPATGYSGLVKGKPAVVVYARGGAYEGEASGMDHQQPYIQQMLGFFGFTNVHPVVIEPTLAAPDAVAETESTAIDLARNLALKF
ncbi:FMN-dependent NADH-azoreductase [Rubripirellula reticaptiva]|uniref:FMN dependent NADH:quinone oxidoreductase n=1 Tax=Rubripirellula reticaptiva TaxID=2528013 RepID=A0A5C6EAL7_9BACT|nr:NAD(P)H-dependent oxidoreductase [Rubripirellula reticaptiva]TWU46763.1 FMN-dependent NADH-azoreductase 1 [Rubripirellula reticaptiva]